MKTFAIFLCIALLIPCSINADQDKTKQELQTAKQVLSIMKEQMQQLTDRFKKTRSLSRDNMSSRQSKFSPVSESNCRL